MNGKRFMNEILVLWVEYMSIHQYHTRSMFSYKAQYINTWEMSHLIGKRPQPQAMKIIFFFFLAINTVYHTAHTRNSFCKASSCLAEPRCQIVCFIVSGRSHSTVWCDYSVDAIWCLLRKTMRKFIVNLFRCKHTFRY